MQLNTLEFRVGGMTCVNCQNRIERALTRTYGVESARVNYSDGRALVEYDAKETDAREIEATIEGLGYRVLPGKKKRKPPGPKEHKGDGSFCVEEAIDDSGATGGSRGASLARGLDVRRVIGILIIVVAAFFILRNLGFTTSFGDIPLAEDGMGYGLLFVIGLLTSVHCVAMCGGINISQCIPAGAGASAESAGEHKKNRPLCADESAGASAESAGEHKKNRPLCVARSSRGARGGVAAAFAPGLKYNLARVCSYTVVGAVVGGIGSAISLSGDVKGLIQLIAGGFMVIMGLSMFGVLPGIGRLVPRMPRIFGDRVESARSGGKGPIVVGLLNGLMPCGPLQAMQIFALSTGSPVQGAVSMLCFSLGTVPLMFGLGALSSILGGRFTARAMVVGAALVIFLGLFMLTQGLTLSGVNVPGGGNSLYIARGAGTDASPGGEGAGSGSVVNIPAALSEGCCTPDGGAGGSGGSGGAGGLPDRGSAAADGGTGADGGAGADGGTGAGDGTGADGGVGAGAGANGDAGAGGGAGANGAGAGTNGDTGAAGGAGADGAGAAGGAETPNGGTDADGSYTDGEGNYYATEDGVQVVRSVLDRWGYPHITVKAGAPVHWIIDAPDRSINGCNATIYIPEYNIEHSFNLGENVIDFTPEKPGEFMYSCWMGMITSSITVEA
jgi:sulfite exporter TauE/SafE/copper chaperone CopZ